MTKNQETKCCSKCKKDKKLSDSYYMASSNLIHTDGKLGICKSCLEEIIDFKNAESLKNVLRAIDRPFLTEAYEGSFATNPNNPFKEYMRRLGMKQNRELTWNDSDFNKPTNLSNEVEINYDEEDLDMNELIRFFGRGFDNEDYYWLHSEYSDFLNRYECDSKGMELLIKEICLTELDIKKRRALNEKVDQQLKTLQDLLGSSNLKPVQETGANAVEQETFGTLIKKYENEKPIPEPEAKWKDVDGVSRYIRVFFLGHLTRMLGIKNDYENEYWDEMNKYTVNEPVSEDEDVLTDGRI